MLKNYLNVLWAKKSIDINKNPKWLPLKQHLLDISSIITHLYKSYLSVNQRDIIKNSISKDNNTLANDYDACKLVRFIALVHDIGKATPAFQLKPSYQGLKDLDKIINNRLKNNGFIPLKNKLLMHANKSQHSIAGEYILNNFGIRDDIASIVGGHHGKTIDFKSDVDKQIAYPKNYYFGIKYSQNSTTEKWYQAQYDFFQFALKYSKYNNKDNIPKIKTISAQVILEGLLVMADWISSNENFFPLFSIEKMSSNDKDRYKHGWQAWKETSPWHPKNHYNSRNYFIDRFGFKPNNLQNKLFNVMNQTKHPGIIIIESGMGSGKTEAALSTVEQTAKKDQSNGLFYCLPTQATTNSMFKRIKRWENKISDETNSTKAIRLVHGKAALNKDFSSLPKSFQNMDINNNKESGLLINEWFSGNKRAILDDFVVGTIDQLLLLSLKQKHLALRHLGLSRKVIVIDEAHTFDNYMQQYLYRALNWLGHYHVPVIILSATLPAKKRINMINSYLNNGNYFDKKDSSYPLITYSDQGKVKTIDDFKQTNHISIKIVEFNEKHLITTLHDLLDCDGGIVGIIVNTVKRAQQLGNQLINEFGSKYVEILHASFIATDRTKKENNLLSTIGKNNVNRPKKKIIIGTQVLEQSLDIDFDVMFSDLAPIDLLLQRVGRLHRHNVNNDRRPRILKKPTLYILQTTTDYQFESGASFIYGKYLLMRTQYYLSNKINLPQDISKLVQTVYSDKQLQLLKDNNYFQKDEYKQQSIKDNIDIKLNDDLMKQYGKYAKKYVLNNKKALDRSEVFKLEKYESLHDNLIGWLKDSNLDNNMNLARVRDGANSIEVIVVQRSINNDYKLLDDAKTSDGLSNKIHNPKIAQKVARYTLNLPNQITKDDNNQYNIDNVINELKDIKKNKLFGWEQQPWLKDKLGIILDKHNQCTLNGYQLTYDNKLGLIYNPIQDY